MRWVGCIVVLLVTAVAGAQEPLMLLPVDQTVADYDPLATSFRFIDPGIGQFSERVRLYSPVSESTWGALGVPSVNSATGLSLPGAYQLRSPGVHAFIGRPEYLVRTGPGRRDFALNQVPYRDGAFVEIASADTVFNLIPQLANPQMTLPPKPLFDARTNWQLDLRIDTRLDLRIDTMLDTRINGETSAYNTIR